MAASDAIPVPRKNIAFRFYFAIRKPSDSTLITTWTGMDSEVSLDGAAFADCTNEATEIGTSGVGYIDLTSSEMNADSVVLKITVTNSGAVPLVFTLCPETAGDYRVADTQKVDVETIKTQALTAAAGITFGIYVGGTAAAAIASTALDATTAGKIDSILEDTGTTLPAAIAAIQGGGGLGDASQDTLLEVKTQTDKIGTALGISALLAAAVLEPGTITSFPEVLTIGDSYTTQNGRAINLPVVDTNGNPLSSTGSLSFANASVTFTIQRAGETNSARVITGSASFVDPPGTGTGAGAPYAVIELPASETAKGLAKYKYSGILTFTWTGTGTDVMSFETGTITFDN